MFKLNRSVITKKFYIILYVILFVYLLALIYKLDYRNFIWDESQHAGTSIFWLDFVKYYFKHPTLDLEKIKAYSLNYQSHYPFFSFMLQHPPIQRIVGFISFVFFGINEVSARLPSVFFSILGLYFTFLLARSITDNKWIGLLSTVLLGLSPMYYEFSRLAMLDIPFTAMTVITMYFFYRYLKHHKKRDSVLFGVFLGLSFLTKYPAILIVFSLALFLLFTKNYTLLRDKNLYKSLLIAAIVGLPYLIFINVFPSIFNIPYIFSKVYRSYFTINVVGIELLTFFYFKQLSFLIGLIAILGILYSLYKKGKSNIFLLSWILPLYIIFPFFVIYTDAIHRYTMPAMPALMILTSIFLYEITNRPKIKKYQPIVILTILLFSFYLCLEYKSKVEIRYPMDETAAWVLNNTPKNGGIIYDDLGQQFYFMKHDRDLSIGVMGVRFPNISISQHFESLLHDEYSNPLYREAGIKNPDFYYFILKEKPIGEKHILGEFYGKNIYNFDNFNQNFYDDITEYLDQNKNVFELTEVFYDDESRHKILVYKINPV